MALNWFQMTKAYVSIMCFPHFWSHTSTVEDISHFFFNVWFTTQMQSSYQYCTFWINCPILIKNPILWSNVTFSFSRMFHLSMDSAEEWEIFILDLLILDWLGTGLRCIKWLPFKKNVPNESLLGFLIHLKCVEPNKAGTSLSSECDWTQDHIKVTI